MEVEGPDHNLMINANIQNTQSNSISKTKQKKQRFQKKIRQKNNKGDQGISNNFKFQMSQQDENNDKSNKFHDKKNEKRDFKSIPPTKKIQKQTNQIDQNNSRFQNKTKDYQKPYNKDGNFQKNKTKNSKQNSTHQSQKQNKIQNYANVDEFGVNENYFNIEEKVDHSEEYPENFVLNSEKNHDGFSDTSSEVDYEKLLKSHSKNPPPKKGRSGSFQMEKIDNKNEEIQDKKQIRNFKKNDQKDFKKTSKDTQNQNIVEINQDQNEPEEEEQLPSIFSSQSFSKLNLNQKLASGLQEQKMDTLTLIQQEVIPKLIEDFKIEDQVKNYCIKSETGSGKTLAYMVPILNYLASKQSKINRNDGSYVIVVCPTRELVIQCMEICKKIMHWIGWIILGEIMGGENIKKEKPRLRKGISVLFTTTGRLLYHLQNTQSFIYTNMKFLVFEECDRTLDMGFRNDLEKIIGKVIKVLISATFSEQVKHLYSQMADEEVTYFGFNSQKQPKKQIQQKPKNQDNQDQNMENEIQQNEEEIMEEEEYGIQGDENLIVPKTLKQKYALVHEEDRISFLISFMFDLKVGSKVIIFVATCDEVEYLQYSDKKLLPYEVYKLHGNIEQKDRTKTFFDFKKTKSSSVLISTEVASRGLDFPDVSHSILLDPPSGIIDYCNRIGRTARIDKIGISLLILNQKESAFVEKLAEKNIKIKYFDYTQVVENFNEMLRDDWGIGTRAIEYIRGCLKVLFIERENYLLARRAYNSFLRAYARLQFREIFQLKNMNLQNLAKSFGMISVGSKGTETKDERYKTGLKQANFEKFRHQKEHVQEKKGDFKGKRKVVHSSKVIASEFM